MKALVKENMTDKGFVLKEVPVPVPKEGEALIRVKAVGICGTDVHIYHNEVAVDTPVIIGHEFCGVVKENNSNRTDIRKGDRIISRLNLNVCGKCRACLSGNPHMCEHRACPGFKRDGAYAEYIAIDASQLVKLEDDVDFEEGALAEPMAIVTHALLERTLLEAEDTVVIFGPGPIGLIALGLCRAYGVSKTVVVGTDVDEALRIPAAKKMGADLVLNAQRDDVLGIVHELTNGQGADLVIEASGATPAINTGIELLRRQGRMCVLGLPAKRSINTNWLTASEKSLDLVFNYSSSPIAWIKVASMIGRGVLDAKTLITHSYPLERYDELFNEIAKGNVIKGMLLP